MAYGNEFRRYSSVPQTPVGPSLLEIALEKQRPVEVKFDSEGRPIKGPQLMSEAKFIEHHPGTIADMNQAAITQVSGIPHGVQSNVAGVLKKFPDNYDCS